MELLINLIKGILINRSIFNVFESVFLPEIFNKIELFGIEILDAH
jgi:hypothetical protein